MSDPTYRIELDHTPGEAFRWYCKVYRLADDFAPVFVTHGDVAVEVKGRAFEWIAEQNVKQPTEVIYVDDDGRPVEGHSVKA